MTARAQRQSAADRVRECARILDGTALALGLAPLS
jgi:hypothetical protein